MTHGPRALPALVVILAALIATATAHAAQPALVVTSEASTDQLLAMFSIGSDGALAPFTGSPFALPARLFGQAVTPDAKRLYVLDHPTLSTAALLPYAIGDGTLTAGTAIPLPDNTAPSAISISPDGRRLYLANFFGSVSGYAITDAGSIAALPGSPYPATLAVHSAIAMTPDGRHLFVTDFATSNNVVSAFNVAADGSLAAAPGSPYSVGNRSNGARVGPDGRHLYVTNIDAPYVVPFTVNADGSLTALASPSGASAVNSPPEISRDGSTLYAGQLDGTVLAYRIAADGTLSPLTGSPFPGVTGGGYFPVDLHLTPDGTKLFALEQVSGGSGTSQIARYDLPLSGAPSQVTSSGTTGPNQSATLITPDPGPVALVSATPAGPGQATAFTAGGSAATVPLYGTLRYDWSFGDGASAPGAGPSVAHVYAAPGTYQASVTVTDAAGCSAALVFTGVTPFCAADPAATAAVTVTVPAPPESPPAAGPATTPPPPTTPTTKACASRRHFTAKDLGLKKSEKIVKVQLLDGKKPARKLKAGKRSVDVKLTGLPKDTFQLKITIKRSGHKSRTVKRTYKTCQRA